MSNVSKRALVLAILLAGVIAAALFVWRCGGSDGRGDLEGGEATASKLAPTRVTGERSADEPFRPPEVSADADPAGPLRLEGQVLGDGDVPVAGATVSLASNPPRTAESGEDGTFAFDALIGKTYWLSAHKDDLVGGPVSRVLTEESEPVVIRLVRGAILEVEVVAAGTDAPVAGARVKLATREETTAADGRVHFRGVSTGWQSVSAVADGFGPATQLLEIPPGPAVEKKIRLALRPGASVSGRVVSRAGGPIAGARVTAEDASQAFSFGGEEPAVTDAEGRFRFPALAAATYRFVAHHKEHPPGSSELIALDGESEQTGVEIVLEDGAVLAGSVVGEGGEPVAWATVRVRTRTTGIQGFGASVREATAGEDGRFEMRGLPRRAVTAAARSDRASSEPVEVDLGERSEVRDLLLRLDVTGVIAGVVVDGDGEPLAEAQVVAFPDYWSGGDIDDFALRGTSNQSTDGGGGFAFRGLPEGSYILHASRTRVDAGLWQRKGTQARTGQTDLRLVLLSPGKIRGRVLDAEGSAPELFTVSLGAFQAGVPFAGTDGRFELPEAASGRHDVRVRAPGFTDAVRRDVEVRPGQTTDLGTITVEAGRAVSGRVLDASGSPVPGALVAAGRHLLGDGNSMLTDFGMGMEEMFGVRRVDSDERGAYRITGIGDQKLVLAAEHAAHGRSQPVRIPPGAGSLTVDLVLQPFGSLHGKVTIDGEPAGAAQVSASSRGNPDQGVMVTAGDDGSFRFERLPAGSYSLTAMVGAGLGSGDIGNADATVTAGAETRADIEIEGGTIELAVTIRGEGGARIDAAQIFLFDGAVRAENAEQIQEAFMAARGVKMTFALGDSPATFERVRPGEKSLCVIPLSGDLSDPTFLARVQEHAMHLAVHCRPQRVGESPLSQTASVTVPPMAPLPGDD